MEDLPTRRILTIGGVVLLVLVLLAGVVVATGGVQPPTVEGVENDWGTVTDETTAIETRVTVNNPNPVGIPGILAVEYTASLNDVVLTENRESGIGMGTGQSAIELSSEMENDKISAWWVTHVNNDETSTLTIDSSVGGFGITRELPTQTSTVETDLLSQLGTAESREVTVQNRSILILGNQQAQWGTATAETTPLTFTAEVENVHNYSIQMDGVAYNVTMNDVTVGSGTTAEGFELEPGESGTLRVQTELDSQAFGRWWPSHVRNDETSEMAVELNAVVEENGTRQEIPVSLYQQRFEFDTDLLGSGATEVQPLPVERPLELQEPTIGDTTQQWGTVTDDSTEIHSDVAIDNPNNQTELNDLVRVSISTDTTINDVQFGSGENRNASLSAGRNDIRVTTVLDNQQVPRWWAAHINSGEQSAVRTTTDTVLDLGVTKLGTETPDTTGTFETDLLGGLNSQQPQQLTAGGETVFTVQSTSAEWGTATPGRAPLSVTTRLENEQPAPVTIESISYTVSINGIELANDTEAKGTVLSAGQTRDVDLQMTLDNAKMDRWWVTHIRNDEQSTFDVDATATVRVGGQTREVPLDNVVTNKTVETDILG